MKGAELLLPPRQQRDSLWVKREACLLWGLFTSLAVPLEHSNDSGSCSPPEAVTQKGMEGNLTWAYSLCVPPWTSKLWECYDDSLVDLWRNGEMLPETVTAPHVPEALPFSAQQHRAERHRELGTMSTLHLKSCVTQTSPTVFGKCGLLWAAIIYTTGH